MKFSNKRISPATSLMQHCIVVVETLSSLRQNIQSCPAKAAHVKNDTPYNCLKEKLNLKQQQKNKKSGTALEMLAT